MSSPVLQREKKLKFPCAASQFYLSYFYTSYSIAAATTSLHLVNISIIMVVALWYSVTIELDSEGASITVVGEEPCPILVRTRLLDQQLVRGMVNEGPEISLSVVGSVSESKRRVNFVNLKLLSDALCRQFGTLKERGIRKIIVVKES
jgi:hypothetical protein